MRWFGLEVEGVPNWEQQKRVNMRLWFCIGLLFAVNGWIAYHNYLYNEALSSEYVQSQEQYREYIRLHKERDRMEFVKDSLEVERLKNAR